MNEGCLPCRVNQPHSFHDDGSPNASYSLEGRQPPTHVEETNNNVTQYSKNTMDYAIKDSGQRQEFGGGAVRDTEEGKLDWSNLFKWFEPMATRFVTHMTKGRSKYPDPQPGVPNWTLFEATPENLARTERSLDRHYKAYRAGLTDEDHAAAILFNINLAENIREELDNNA